MYSSMEATSGFGMDPPSSRPDLRLLAAPFRYNDRESPEHVAFRLEDTTDLMICQGRVLKHLACADLALDLKSAIVVRLPLSRW
jgi:hypothetical protein